MNSLNKNQRAMGAGSTILIVLAILAVTGLAVFGGIWLGQGNALSQGAAQPLGTSAANTGVQSTCGLSAAQTMSFTTTKAGTATQISPTFGIYPDPVSQPLTTVTNGTLNAGASYAELGTLSSYFKVYIPAANTPCGTSAPITTSMDAVDTAMAATAYQAGSYTANSVTNNASASASSTVSFTLNVVPSATYVHISGPQNTFTVFFNATNQSYWDATKFTASFNGVACTPYTGNTNLFTGGAASAQLPSALGGVSVTAVTCTGDFTGTDRATYPLAVTVGTSASYAASGSVLSVTILGNDIYANTITGALEIGPVKNDGSAIQTAQAFPLYIK